MKLNRHEYKPAPDFMLCTNKCLELIIYIYIYMCVFERPYFKDKVENEGQVKDGEVNTTTTLILKLNDSSEDCMPLLLSRT